MFNVIILIGIIVFYVILIKRVNDDLSYPLTTKTEFFGAVINFFMIGFFTLIPNYFLAGILNWRDTIPHMFVGCTAMGGGKDGPYITQYLVAWALFPLINHVFKRSKPQSVDL